MVTVGATEGREGLAILTLVERFDDESLELSVWGPAKLTEHLGEVEIVTARTRWEKERGRVDWGAWEGYGRLMVQWVRYGRSGRLTVLECLY